MAEFGKQDLSGSTFDWTDLSGSVFRAASLSNVTIRGTDLHHVRMRGVELHDVDITGEIDGLRINGVDVTAFVEEELLRREPDLARMRPTDLAGFREAWDRIEALWEGTVERARRLDPALLDEHVDEEWSFIQTLRHLSFATDAWVNRMIRGIPAPWHPLELPWDEAPDIENVSPDREARPSLDEVLVLRRSRQDDVRQVLDGLTEQTLAADAVPPDESGWPNWTVPVKQCLSIVLNEEWWHRQYAERDLSTLEGRAS